MSHIGNFNNKVKSSQYVGPGRQILSRNMYPSILASRKPSARAFFLYQDPL